MPSEETADFLHKKIKSIHEEILKARHEGRLECASCDWAFEPNEEVHIHTKVTEENGRYSLHLTPLCKTCHEIKRRG